MYLHIKNRDYIKQFLSLLTYYINLSTRSAGVFALNVNLTAVMVSLETEILSEILSESIERMLNRLYFGLDVFWCDL